MSSEHNTRLIALQAAIQAAGLDGFIVPRSDEHLGEYVPPSAERLAWLTGFTGSFGVAIVLRDRAAIWSDGRYVLQLQMQTGDEWERFNWTDGKPWDWVKDHAAGKKIGYDPWLIPAEILGYFHGSDLVPVANLVDGIWAERPAPPTSPAMPHPVQYTGADSAEKREKLADILKKAGQDAAVLTDPASLAWTFNLRAADVEFCPIPLGFAIVNADATATIFMPPEKIPPETLDHLGNSVAVADRSALPAALAALAGKTVRYDPATQPVWFKTTLAAAGAKISEAPDPVLLPRATKNATEIAGSRAAHLRDGVAMAHFLAWLAKAAPTGNETEISAAEHLLACRARGDLFKGESFPAISGAGEHGAIIHYRVTPETNRQIKPDEVYLIDSGGQYLDGTTDITRTIWTGPGAAPAEVKAHVTRVLAGHIALSQAVFPEGVAGAHLDALARGALWQAGLDYDHGTGHGVGAYLSVHEGPVNISRQAKPVPLAAGMILSNEPGYYLPGAYGIRMENLVLVQPADFPGKKTFLHFETLTLAPFDRALIEPALLSAEALAWLNAYHARVFLELSPHLAAAPETLAWLREATATI
jgi:Xaa-Pro aminopeptidase